MKADRRTAPRRRAARFPWLVRAAARRAVGAFIVAMAVMPVPAGAQRTEPAPTRLAQHAASTHDIAAFRSPPARHEKRRHYAVMALGFATSIAAHELGHVAASLAVGGRPTVGIDHFRPVVYSGIDPVAEPDKQLVFSSAGLIVQIVLDELILDIPHSRAGAFERGILAGGISTGLFYALASTRTSSVSDVTHIANTSGLSQTQVGLILGAVSSLHALRVATHGRYGEFFAIPGAEGELLVGLLLRTR